MAILTPNGSAESKAYAGVLKTHIARKLKVLDDSLSASAFASAAPANPFNLTTEEAKNIGATIGCDFFILLRSISQRRSAFGRADYYEAYAVIYLVSSRSGRLILWKLSSFENVKKEKALILLDDSTAALAGDVLDRIKTTSKAELNEPVPPEIEEVPETDSPAAKNFRAPIPFSRVKPDYTAIAAFYDIAATVDILVDMDAEGKILNTGIVRWAGFGLDESVEKTVREMNWRAAERNGKFLPMRFLLRYNFKKFEKEK